MPIKEVLLNHSRNCELERNLLKTDPDCPIHNLKRTQFCCIQSIPGIVEKYPLDESFIDWLYDQGFKIKYSFYWEEGRGYLYSKVREIVVSGYGSRELVDLTLGHELWHIALNKSVSRFSAMASYRDEYIRFEEALDNAAKITIKDAQFMNYLREKIPSNLYFPPVGQLKFIDFPESPIQT